MFKMIMPMSHGTVHLMDERGCLSAPWGCQGLARGGEGNMASVVSSRWAEFWSIPQFKVIQEQEEAAGCGEQRMNSQNPWQNLRLVLGASPTPMAVPFLLLCRRKSPLPWLPSPQSFCILYVETNFQETLLKARTHFPSFLTKCVQHRLAYPWWVKTVLLSRHSGQGLCHRAVRGLGEVNWRGLIPYTNWPSSLCFFGG